MVPVKITYDNAAGPSTVGTVSANSVSALVTTSSTDVKSFVRVEFLKYVRERNNKSVELHFGKYINM